MGNVIYSAIDIDGKQRYGFCEAANNREVLNRLKDKNFSDIKLYGDAVVALPLSDDIKSLSGIEKERKAKDEIEMLLNPGFKTFFMLQMRDFKKIFFIPLGIVISLWGFYASSLGIILVGLLLVIAVPIFWRLAYTLTDNFYKLYTAYYLGEWDKAWDLLESYYVHEKILPEDVKVHLDTMGAKLLAIDSNSNEAVEKVQHKYGFLKQSSPLKYDILLGEIYAMNGEYDDALKVLQKLYTENKESAVFQLDLLLAEAYLGNKIESNKLLETLNIEELEVFVQPMVDVAYGILSLDEDNNKALHYFEKAIASMKSYRNNIFSLVPLSIAMSYYAIALFDINQKREAKDALEAVWSITAVHGHRSLLEAIFERMPEYKNKDK
jgi:hypothetical protein